MGCRFSLNRPARSLLFPGFHYVHVYLYTIQYIRIYNIHITSSWFLFDFVWFMIINKHMHGEATPHVIPFLAGVEGFIVERVPPPSNGFLRALLLFWCLLDPEIGIKRRGSKRWSRWNRWSRWRFLFPKIEIINDDNEEWIFTIVSPILVLCVLPHDAATHKCVEVFRYQNPKDFFSF